MEIKEIHDMIPKFKKGRLYLYQPTDYLKSKGFNNVPVLALRINKNYPTWLCLFPNGSTGGCHPKNLKDITLKLNE